LNEPVIVDIKAIPYNQSCPEDYKDISTTSFPATAPGCRCDYKIFTEETCNEIYKNLNKSKNYYQGCLFQEKVKKGGRPRIPITRILQDISDQIPESCECFSFIDSIRNDKIIDRWVNDQRICLKKDKKVTTLNYLSSAFYKKCDKENVCQNYFCKHNNQANYSCPIVDMNWDHTYTPDIYLKSPNKALQFNSNIWDLVTSTYYNETFTGSKNFHSTILIPMIGVHISRNGKCVSGENSLQTGYALIPEQKCPLDQRFFTSSKLDMQTVLNANDGYYDFLQGRLPLFDFFSSSDNKWTLDLEYAFYRNTISCLLSNYDTLFPDLVKNIDTTLPYKAQQKVKLSRILKSLITLNYSNLFLKFIQISILALNINVVVLNVAIILYKFLRMFFPKKIIIFFENEVYISFIMDLLIAILGGFSFFSMNYYQDKINLLLQQECADDFVKYTLTAYCDSMQGAAEQNLQIFVIMLFKLFILIFSILYYVFLDNCKMRCHQIGKLIKDNLNDGENPEGGVEGGYGMKKSSSSEFKQVSYESVSQLRRAGLITERDVISQFDNNSANPMGPMAVVEEMSCEDFESKKSRKSPSVRSYLKVAPERPEDGNNIIDHDYKLKFIGEKKEVNSGDSSNEKMNSSEANIFCNEKYLTYNQKKISKNGFPLTPINHASSKDLELTSKSFKMNNKISDLKLI
jgi:hypothetical protein